MLSTEPGAKVGPIGQGVSDRVAAGMPRTPAGTWSSHTLSDARVTVVPVVNWSGCNGNCSVPVIGFAEVWISGTSGADITAVFIRQVAAGTPGIWRDEHGRGSCSANAVSSADCKRIEAHRQFQAGNIGKKRLQGSSR